MDAAIKGETVEFEADIPFRKAGTRFMHVNYVPERDASGAVRGFIAALTDISARRELENELRESQRLE